MTNSTPTADPVAPLQAHLRSEYLVVDEAKFERKGDRAAVVVIRSENPELPRSIEELGSMKAKKLALTYAASRGIASPALNGFAAPYPLVAGGIPLQEMTDKGFKLTDKECAVIGYAIAIPVTAT